MNHPSYEVLQDYFENAIDSELEKKVKQHLQSCDKCTQVLSQFSMIETKLHLQEGITVSLRTENLIFSDVRSLLLQKRTQLQKDSERNEMLSKFVAEWKESIFPELRIPAIQLASLSLVLTVLVSMEKSQGTYEETFKPISNDVTVISVED